MFIYFLAIRRVKLLHFRSSRFYIGYKNQEVAGKLQEDSEKKKKKKRVAWDQMEGLLPISSPGSRHNKWCRDREGVHARKARRLRTQQRATAKPPPPPPPPPNMGASERQVFLGPKS